jgi:hypothetical protein
MSGSNNVNDSENAASGLNINGGSDNGSGNQPVQAQRNHCPGPTAGNGDEDCQALSEDKSSSGTHLYFPCDDIVIEIFWSKTLVVSHLVENGQIQCSWSLQMDVVKWFFLSSVSRSTRNS